MTVFWRTFLGFWMAIAILLAIVFSADSVWPYKAKRSVPSKSTIPAVALNVALQAYEQGGANAFTAAVQRIPGIQGAVTLFATDGQVLAHDNEPTPSLSALASQTRKSRTPEIARLGMRIALAIPVESVSGKRYIIVMTALKPVRNRFLRLRFWTKLAIAMVPATLICLGLALYITRPITKLRLTARRLADGDLAARPPQNQKQKSDEIGELSRDIDTMAQRIQELMAAQRRFVASVSHELGAPLTRMQLAITLLQRGADTHELEGMDQIERDADRLSQLVQELLFLASLERGALPAETFGPVQLNSLCQEVVRDNAAEAEEKNCSISTSFEEVSIQAAPQALRRAIENVYRNAIRHTAQGTTIHFNCEASRPPGSAVIEIIDNGPGVPADMLAKIFQPFIRVETDPTRSEGTGLGLAIASEAVALHGGRIRAKNGNNGGLIVTIDVPRRT